MKLCRVYILLTLLAGAFGMPVLPNLAGIVSPATAVLELYGTFSSMGVIVTLEGPDDPDRDATANLVYRASGDVVFRQGFPLTRAAVSVSTAQPMGTAPLSATTPSTTSLMALASVQTRAAR